jgi:DNA-binding NtrC family response regulator
MANAVWLIEDDKAISRLLQRSLESGGYTVRAFYSAEDAEAEAEADGQAPNIIIADQTLPGKLGVQFADDAMRRWPAVRCLLCSGLPLDLRDFREELRPRVAFLQKPFLPPALLSALRSLAVDA